MRDLLPTAVLVCVASVVFAEKHSFERYQPIIERQMFGPLPPDFDPSKLPSEVQKTSAKSGAQLTQEQEKLKCSIHFSVINVTPEGGVVVGFTDVTNPDVPVHYYLKVGEKTSDGWEVKDADPDAATMTIAKDGIEVPMVLGGNSAKDGGASRGRAEASTPAANVDAARPGLLSGSFTIREKRKERRELAAQKKQEELVDRFWNEISDKIKKDFEAKSAAGSEDSGDGSANNETE